MRLSCPSCHAEFDLNAALEDRAGREFVRWLSQLPTGLPRPMVAYLTLFRSKSRALAWDRAHRLGDEVLALSADIPHLARALSHTVESLRRKQTDDWKPLGNHNYLKSVLDTLEPLPTPAAAPPLATTMTGASRTAQALEQLNSYQHPTAPPELVEAIRDIFKRLIVLRLEDQPVLDTIVLVADEWLDFLSPLLSHLPPAEQARALHSACDQLRGRSQRWPALSQVYPLLPRRPASGSLLPEPTTEEVLREHERLQGGGAAAAPRREVPAGLRSLKETMRSIGLPVTNHAQDPNRKEKDP